MKKIVAISLTLAILMSLAACAASAPSAPETENIPSEDAAPEITGEPTSAEMAETGTTDPSVAVFATDRHENAEILPQLLFKMASDGFNPCLVALGGDSVGSGPDIETNINYAPVFDTNVIRGEVDMALSPDVRLAVLMASHDRNMTDSIHVMYKENEGFSCGDFYVYIVPEAYMDNEEAAAEAAVEFMLWAESAEVDPSKPLIVLSHMPIHYLRGDNLGGNTWHQTINWVATAGNEGPVRNIIFFHGHNHAADTTEYCYEAGSSIAIQGFGEDGKSEDIIHYTYITAGYLNQNGTATLLQVEPEQIIVLKYTLEGAEQIAIIPRLK